MPPYDKEILHKLVELTEENNKILKGLQSHMRWGKLWTFLKISVFVGLFVVSYIQLQPYFGTIKSTWQSMLESFKNLQSSGSVIEKLQITSSSTTTPHNLENFLKGI